MEIDKSKKYEIIVFPNQDEGLKAQRVLVSKGEDFKYISTLAVVVPEERNQEAFQAIIKGNAMVSGHYPFLYRDYGEQKLSKCTPLSTEQKFAENKKIMQEMAEALGVA